MGNFELAFVLLLCTVTVYTDEAGVEHSDHVIEDQRPKEFFNNDEWSSWGHLELQRLKRGVGSNNFGIGRGAGANNFGRGRGGKSNKGVFISYNNDKSGNDQGKRGQGSRRTRGTASNNFGNSWGPGANNFGRGGGGPGYNGGYSNQNERFGNDLKQSGNSQGFRYKRGAASNNFGNSWGPGANNFGQGGGGPGYNGGYSSQNDRHGNDPKQSGQGFRIKRGTALNNIENNLG